MGQIRTQLQKSEHVSYTWMSHMYVKGIFFFNWKQRKIHDVRCSELEVTHEFRQYSLYGSMARSTKTLLNQKNMQRGLKLHNCNSVLRYGFTEDFPSKNLKVLYKQERTKSYIQPAYAHFRDYIEVWRVLLGCLKSQWNYVTQENSVLLTLKCLIFHLLLMQ